MKIIAIVVTHNRSQLLQRCLDHIALQTRQADEVLVIDNGSTDSTKEFLSASKINFISQANVGSAGGWNRGIEYALNNDFDACWLMDDDGFPQKNSLEILASHFSDEFSCISSVVLQEKSPQNFVFPLPVLNGYGNSTLCPFSRKIRSLNSSKLQGLGSYNFAHLFNGALISCSAIKKIGNVATKFYMFGDEVDYFFRLRSAGKVISLLDAHHFHPDVTLRPYSEKKILYLLRNTIYLHFKYFDKPQLRNIFVIPLVFIRVIHRNGILFFFNLLMFRAHKLFLAIFDGFMRDLSRDNF